MLVLTVLAPIPDSLAQAIQYDKLEKLFGEPVTTSATGKPQRASDVPVSMVIITRDQIRHSPATDIPGILREYTDLDVWQWSRGDADVSVRGYNSSLNPRLLVLVNGRQVYVDYYGFTNWDTIPVQLSEIRQIEVVKGPNTALFGFNAVGGVINILTYNPLFDQFTDASVRVGTRGYREVSAVTSQKVGDRMGLRLSTGGYDAHNYPIGDRFSGPWAAGSDPYSKSPYKRTINLDTQMQATDDIVVGFEASHAMSYQNQYQFYYFALPDRSSTDSIKASISANTGWGLIDGQIYRNGVHETIEAPDGTTTTFQNAVTTAKLQDMFKIGVDHTFRIAGEYRYNEMNSVPTSGGNAHYSVSSASGMWDWALTSQTTLTNAVRLDHLQLGYDGLMPTGGPYSARDWNRQVLNEVSANSGLVFKATDIDTFRASYSRGLQMPPLADYAYYQPDPTGFSVATGNPKLVPTLVENYELAYTRDLTDAGSKASVVVFYQTNSNLISSNPWTRCNITNCLNGPFPGIFAPDNVGDSRALGTEWGIDGHSESGWRWGGHYRMEWIHDSLRFSNVNADGTLNFPLFFEGGAPHHLFSAHGGYTFGKWDFDLFGRYSTRYDVPNNSQDTKLLTQFTRYTVPPSFTADARIAYNITDNAWLAVNAVNVQSKQVYMTSGPAIARQFYLTAGVRF
ncbi:MAG: TonB-dependent receptor [Rhodospirillaceae bacterium]